MDITTARIYWRALQGATYGSFDNHSAESFVESCTAQDPDCTNAVKIILNASGCIEGHSLPLNGDFEERDAEAMRALAKAAALDENGQLPEEEEPAISSKDGADPAVN